MNTIRLRSTVVRLVLVLVGLSGLWLPAPAEACGCGGYVNEGDAYVTQENVLLRWDGQTEKLLMSLGVLGESTDAAIVLPVPAQATVELGKASTWAELDTLTQPLVVHEKRYVSPFELFAGGSEAGAPMPGAAGGGGPPPVTVLSQQKLGPFEVTNLAATDATALSDWLTEHGYTLSPGLAAAFAPYIEENWYYIAVKLSPGTGNTLSGALDPLLVTFPTQQLVYPMRGSANAKDNEVVTIYVLADHRMDKTEDFGSSLVTYADWVDTSDLHAGSVLTPFVDKKIFLTKFEETVSPTLVDDDFWFTSSPNDLIYHQTVTVYDDDYSLVYLSLAALCLVLLVPVAAVAGVGVFWIRRQRRQGKNSANAT